MTRAAREQIRGRRAHHQRHDGVGGGRRGRAGADIAAVAQDDEAIGDGLHFLDEVRDVDDRLPLRPQPPQQREEVFDVGAAEAARRLVEDEHAAADRQRPRDFDELLLRDRETGSADDGVLVRDDPGRP